jgi:hypothetical protein
VPRSRRARRPPVVLLLVLLVALGIGAAASALAGAAVSNAPSGSSPANVELTGNIVMYAFTAIVLAGAGFLLYRRLTGDVMGIPGEYALVAIVSILLLITFVVVFRSVSGGGPLPTNATAPSGSPGGSPTPNVTGGNHTSNSTAVPVGYWFNPPPWLWFVAVAVIAIVIVVVAVPWARSLVAARGTRVDDVAARAAAGRARAALAGAADALGAGRDPREVIIALYAELLERLGPMVGSLDPDTPEEIRVRHLVRLGISPDRSEALTRLFEEARYSTHPLGAEAALRGEEVIRAAEADLARVVVPG